MRRSLLCLVRPAMRPLSAKPQAFTLIEVMVAATVLVVSFTAVIQAVMMGAEMLDTARKQQIAMEIIKGELNARRTSAWFVNPLANIKVEITPTGATPDHPSTVENDPAYLYFTPSSFKTQGDMGADQNVELRKMAGGFTVEATGANLRTEYRSASITVTWTSISGRTHSRTGVAHYAKNGLHLSYKQ